VPVPLLEPPVLEPPVLEPVLLPEPEPMPLELGDVGLVLLPDAPLPALPLDELPLRASSMHLSRSAPVRPMHLLVSLPDAPDAAEPVDPDVELSLLPEDEPLAEGVVELAPDEPEPPALPAEPPLLDAPAPALPEAPEAPEPLLPEPEPD